MPVGGTVAVGVISVPQQSSDALEEPVSPVRPCAVSRSKRRRLRMVRAAQREPLPKLFLLLASRPAVEMRAEYIVVARRIPVSIFTAMDAQTEAFKAEARIAAITVSTSSPSAKL